MEEGVFTPETAAHAHRLDDAERLRASDSPTLLEAGAVSPTPRQSTATSRVSGGNRNGLGRASP